MESLEEKLKSLQGLSAYGTIDMEDLCLFPDLVIPPKFKLPDFEKYDGKTSPILHLTMYTRSMAAYINNEKLMVHCFQHSLKGSPLQWFLQLDKAKIRGWRDLAESFVNQYRFNAEITPDRFELQRMSKGENETFKGYAQRWREIAAQVQPPLTEREHITTFVSTLKGVYFEKLVGTITTNFSDLVITGGQVEDAIRHGKLIDTSAKPTDSSAKKPMF